MRKFQIILSVIFGAFIVFAVLVFSGLIPSPKQAQDAMTKGNLVMWGTQDKITMYQFFEKSLLGSDITIDYVQKTADTFPEDIIEALASGTGPDIIILPQELTLRLEDKIAPFTPDLYAERDFMNAFIQNGEIFIRPNGIVALPILTDPLVMYWNRDIFTNKNLVLPPKYWDEFLVMAPILTEQDSANNITKSAISFGEYQNVTNAKDILATLILQTGNPIVSNASGVLTPTLVGAPDSNIPSSSEVLRFYTDFADPLKTIYSWNRSLNESKKAFLAGDLAVYFGYASELYDLRAKNPNLNFDVAVVPQIRDWPRKTTFGRIEGLAVMKASKAKSAAFYISTILTNPTNSSIMASIFKTPSPSREVLAKTPADPYMKVFYDSAIISKSWLDPNRISTGNIFKSTIEDINSGKTPVLDAVANEQILFAQLFPQR